PLQSPRTGAADHPRAHPVLPTVRSAPAGGGRVGRSPRERAGLPDPPGRPADGRSAGRFRPARATGFPDPARHTLAGGGAACRPGGSPAALVPCPSGSPGRGGAAGFATNRRGAGERRGDETVTPPTLSRPEFEALLREQEDLVGLVNDLEYQLY